MNLSLTGIFYGLSLMYIVYEITKFFYNDKQSMRKSFKVLNEKIKLAVSKEEKSLIVKENLNLYGTMLFEFIYMLWVIIGMILPTFRWLFVMYFVYSYFVNKAIKKLEEKNNVKALKKIDLLDMIISLIFLVKVFILNIPIIFPFLA